MSKPRVFISSTYYDLKHVRSSLDNFVEALGFDAVLSEKGDIAYSPDAPLDESCYREASDADIFVLIVGGRYGSPSSNDKKKLPQGFFDRYDSITRREYESAVTRDIPVYVLIEQNVYSEYHTYLKNQDSQAVQYAHVDSVNVFQLIHEILARPRNSPVHTFERFADIETWLREQWAGLFRELLQRMTNQKQLASLSAQVETLGAINSTLQRYLEAIVSKVSPEDARDLIRSEHIRLEEAEQLEQLRLNDFYRFASCMVDVDVRDFRDALTRADTVRDFARELSSIAGDPELEERVLPYEYSAIAIRDLNEGRSVVGKAPFELPEAEEGSPLFAMRHRRKKK